MQKRENKTILNKSVIRLFGIEPEECTTNPRSKPIFFFIQDFESVEMTVQKLIDENGGDINHPFANLSIPPGALSKPVNITLRILKDLHPGTIPNKVSLSPVVSCKPHGLRFQKPVTLTIGHCVHSADTKEGSVSVRTMLCAKQKNPFPIHQSKNSMRLL